MDSAFRRITKLQRHILRTIRADLRKVLGTQPADIRRYRSTYEREFRKPLRQSSKEQLVSQALRSDIILMGDYHTFAQSQKAALRLLRELIENPRPMVLGLELVGAEHQATLDGFMAGKLDEEAFLAAIDYEQTWGFPWEHFRPLFDLARENNMRVLALNHGSQSLKVRDAHAARLIADCATASPEARIFVLYGDLHLARGHIPRQIQRELRGRGEARRKLLVVFQNSEQVYWKLASQRLSHAVDVVQLGRGRFCIMNAAPWVKHQSYLEWAEASELYTAVDGAGDLNDIARERLRDLSTALRLELPESLTFTITTIDDLGFLAGAGKGAPSLEGLGRDEVRAIKYLVLGNRNAFVPATGMAYLTSASVNSIAEAVTRIAHVALSGACEVYHDPARHFYGAVLDNAIAYFGSKILNPKRKCSLEDDYRLLLEQRPAAGLSRREKSLERFQRCVARLVLRHCRAQRQYFTNGRYQAPLTQAGRWRVPLFLEAAHRLGAILGEKLYAAYLAGQFPHGKVIALFSTRFDRPRQARATYLELVKSLGSAPLTHSSKSDLF